MGRDDGQDDLFEARAARDEGMARVEAHATPGWADAMFALVEEVARVKVTFTSDDVFELALARGIYHGTHDRRAFGPVMLRAVKAGLCRKANLPGVLCRRASRHAAPLSVWVSLWRAAR